MTKTIVNKEVSFIATANVTSKYIGTLMLTATIGRHAFINIYIEQE